MASGLSIEGSPRRTTSSMRRTILLLIPGHPAADGQVVGGVIGGEEAVAETRVRYDDAQFFQEIEGARQHEGPGPCFLIEGCVRGDHDGQNAGEIRVYVRENAGRVSRVLHAILDTADAEKHRYGKRDPRFLHPFRRFDDLLVGGALADFLQQLRVARLDPQVDDAESPFLQLAELLEGLFQEALRVGVSPDAADSGQVLPDGIEDVDESLLRDDEGVAVAEEELVDLTDPPGCIFKIFFDLLEALDAETLVFEARAEGAPVVRAADGDLQQQTGCLAGRPDDVPFVLHCSPWFPP